MTDTPLPPITLAHFSAVAMRVGRIVRAEPNPQARKPAYHLWIDFGPHGLRESSAQLTVRYQPDDLVGRLVVAVVNLPPRQIAGVRSEVLVLGALGAEGDVCLLQPEAEMPLGAPIA